jgi:hypothetical protein
MKTQNIASIFALIFVLSAFSLSLTSQTNIAGTYKCNDGGIYYIGQNGSQVVWLGERSVEGSQFANVFKGTISGNVITGDFWDIPKFNTTPAQTANKGRLVLRLTNGALTISPPASNFGGFSWQKVRAGEQIQKVPSTRPVVASSNRDYNGIWQCNDGGVYYIREDRNNFLWFGESLNNNGNPYFSNVFFGTRSGNTVTGFYVDVPKGTVNSHGTLTLSLSGFNRITKTAPPTGFGGSTWTRPTLNGRMTAFNPTRGDGFRFVNSGQFQFMGDVIKFDGVCGGMVYASLDLFNTRTPVPSIDTFPVNGTPLQRFINGRHSKSWENTTDKWIELNTNPLGSRNSEFFNWGMLSTGGHRLGELREKIDRGVAVPIGLLTAGEWSAFNGANHFAVAIGYHLGRYNGNGGNFKEDLTIFVYDPNFPNRIMSMVADADNAIYFYIEAPFVKWRTYFVDQRYVPVTPTLR